MFVQLVLIREQEKGHTNEKVRKTLEASNNFVDSIWDISTVVVYFCVFFLKQAIFIAFFSSLENQKKDKKIRKQKKRKEKMDEGGVRRRSRYSWWVGLVSCVVDEYQLRRRWNALNNPMKTAIPHIAPSDLSSLFLRECMCMCNSVCMV